MNKNNHNHGWTTVLPLTAALVAFVLSLGGPAYADNKAEAKELFLEGIDHFKDGDYEEALEAFLASDELYHHPDTLVNIANSYAELYEFTKAMQYFEQYLDEKGDDISGADKKEIQNKMERVGKKVGKLVIVPDDVEGDLEIDGEDRGELPLTKPLYLEAGLHQIVVKDDGEVVFEKQINIIGASKTELEMEPEEIEVEDEDVEEEDEDGDEDVEKKKKKKKKKKGAMRVEIEGEETGTVYVDGEEVGETPWEDQFNEGYYSVQVKTEGKPDWKGQVEVQSEKHTVLTVDTDSTKKAPNVNNPLFWAMIGATVPTLVSGIVLSLLGKNINDQADALYQELTNDIYEPPRASAEVKDRIIALQNELVDKGQQHTNAAIAMFVVSGVFAATAVASIFIFRKEVPAATGSFEISGISPLLDPQSKSLGLGLSATF